MKVFYSDRYTLPLPPEHRFPMAKYRMVRDALIAEGVIAPGELCESPLAPREKVLLAHDAEYFASIESGTASRQVMRRIGFPWSHDLFLRSMATVGGALAAADEAMRVGISGNLAGGTHHAHAAEGEGYCVFNDQAVVALSMLESGRARRIAIVDLDVHQGDGNASILAGRDDVYVLSLHGKNNFPFVKVPSTVDIALPDGLGDVGYLEELEIALDGVVAFAPDLILYQAGVDPLAEDKLGKLSLSHSGLFERDRMVLAMARGLGAPISLALGGGYADPISLTVAAHVNTYRAVKEHLGYSERIAVLGH